MALLMDRIHLSLLANESGSSDSFGLERLSLPQQAQVASGACATKTGHLRAQLRANGELVRSGNLVLQMCVLSDIARKMLDLLRSATRRVSGDVPFLHARVA